MDAIKELDQLEIDALALRNYADRVLERVARCRRTLNLSENTLKRKASDNVVSKMKMKIKSEVISGTIKSLKDTRNQ